MQKVDYTAQEKEFANMVQGPGEEMFKHVPLQSRTHPGRKGETATPEALEMLKTAQRLADGPVLAALQDASDDLIRASAWRTFLRTWCSSA